MLKINLFGDRQIIERIKANDHSVLGELFLHYKKMVFTYIKSHGGCEADAEDMLQEAVIVLWQNVCSGKFELTSKIGTYLTAVAKNKWMAEMRKRKKYSDDSLPELSDGNPSSLDMLLEEEKIANIRRALEAIQPVCKKLLMLFYFEERSLEEIAGIMNFSNANVAKSKNYQCKKSLEAVLKRQILLPERRI